MRILAVDPDDVLEKYYGSPLSLMEMLRRLIHDYGHSCVMACRVPEAMNIDGLPLVPYTEWRSLAKGVHCVIFRDIALADDIRWCADAKIPTAVSFASQEFVPAINPVLATWPQDVPYLCIYSTDLLVWTLQSRHPHVVVWPSVNHNRIGNSAGDYITLINLNENKGGRFFYKLAESLPDYRFLGVIGGYADQIIPDVIPPNVTLHPHTKDIARVYDHTRLLLMPSKNEVFGTVATEAAASGIPSLISATTLVVENMQEAGIYLPWNDLDAWKAKICALMEDKEQYALASAKCAERFARYLIQNADQLDALDAYLIEMAAAYYNDDELTRPCGGMRCISLPEPLDDSELFALLDWLKSHPASSGDITLLHMNGFWQPSVILLLYRLPSIRFVHTLASFGREQSAAFAQDMARVARRVFRSWDVWK